MANTARAAMASILVVTQLSQKKKRGDFCFQMKKRFPSLTTGLKGVNTEKSRAEAQIA